MQLDIRSPSEKVHRLLDEAGDTTFLGKGGIPVLGLEGVSLAFGLGIASFRTPMAAIAIFWLF